MPGWPKGCRPAGRCSPRNDGLDARLLAAHAAGDKHALVRLYRAAADGATGPDARAFYLTQALVFALDSADAQAETLQAELAALGRL